MQKSWKFEVSTCTFLLFIVSGLSSEGLRCRYLVRRFLFLLDVVCQDLPSLKFLFVLVLYCVYGN